MTAIIGIPNKLVKEYFRLPYCKVEHNPRMLVYDSRKIVALREAKGWRQAELARRAGLSQPSVWALEHGRTKNVKVTTLNSIAAALGVPPKELMATRPGGANGKAWDQEAEALYEALDDKGKAMLIVIAKTLLQQNRR